jgi:hypothetical protein
MLIMSS